jgi:drug/metabolite transporter (DMT)-like permease
MKVARRPQDNSCNNMRLRLFLTPMQSILHIFPFLHNGVFIALIAHGLIGISLVWDKVLLKRPETTNLVSYVFWLGAISVFGLILIPFGFKMPNGWVAGLAFVTGVLQLVAVYYYYAALKAGEASQTLAVMGGFSPVATALIGMPLLKSQLGGYSLLAFALLTAGGFVMFFAERVPLRKMLFRVLMASIAFGLVNVLEKMVYEQTNFVSGYVFFTFGTFLGAMGMLLLPSWRAQISKESENAEPRSRFWYFVNRFVAGVGSFLIYYAISLTNPALVDAITAVRYVIIFLGAYALTRLKPVWLSENFSGRVLIGKAGATAMVVAGLVILGYTGQGEAGSPSTKLSPSPRHPCPFFLEPAVYAADARVPFPNSSFHSG